MAEEKKLNAKHAQVNVDDKIKYIQNQKKAAFAAIIQMESAKLQFNEELATRKKNAANNILREVEEAEKKLVELTEKAKLKKEEYASVAYNCYATFLTSLTHSKYKITHLSKFMKFILEIRMIQIENYKNTVTVEQFVRLLPDLADFSPCFSPRFAVQCSTSIETC